MTLDEVLKAILGNLGVLVLLLLILYGGYKRWWVWGWYAKELREQNERQEHKLDRAIGAAERGTAFAVRAVDAHERLSGSPDATPTHD